MKVLIIGDVHGRKFWRQVISDNIGKVDKVVFLGDYLDPYPDEIEKDPDSMECKYFENAEELLLVLRDIVSLKKNEPDKYVLLTGNHTDSYIWSKFCAATRTDYKNWEKYHKFFIENLEYFNLIWIEDNTIFSHAGITKGWANDFLSNKEELKDSVILTTAKILKNTSLKKFDKNYINLIGHISFYRGGEFNNGSCEWADLREHIDYSKSISEIIPKGEEGIYQVFGHTQLKQPIITDKWACLDCRKGFIFDTITHEIKEC